MSVYDTSHASRDVRGERSLLDPWDLLDPRVFDDLKWLRSCPASLAPGLIAE